MSERRYGWHVDDSGHLWFLHACTGGHSDVWQAPPPWRVEGEGVVPSLDCEACGLHITVGASERVDGDILAAALEAKLETLLDELTADVQQTRCRDS